MKYIIGFITILTINACSTISSKQELREVKDTMEVNFYTSDSIQVFGDFYKVGKEATTIILFHQARSNARGEYEHIANRLHKKGYNVLAIDQRSGGQLYGSYNRTVAKFSSKNYTYCNAYLDLEGALKFLNESGLDNKVIVWGSSYSAALVVKLATNHPDEINGVLAFSPASGEPMEGCSPNELFSEIKTPLMILRPAQEAEYESVKNQLELAKANGIKTYIAIGGVHGSSMLVESRTKANTDQTWAAVYGFITSL